MHDSTEYIAPPQKEAGLAAELIKYTNASFFLTGKPGAGKKAFLKKIAGEAGKKYIWLSPDNLSAFTAGGTSVHSFFHLPFSPFIWQTADQSQKQIFFNFHAGKKKIIEEVELIIIEDVQLLRADIIDAIDLRLRRFGGKRNLPFGGRQIVFAGDIFQLPEVATDGEWQALSKYYNTPYFFSARSLLKNILPVIEFTHQAATEDLFVSFMELVRSKQVQLPDVQELNQRYATSFLPTEIAGFVTLTADTASADKINLEALKLLPGEFYSYTADLEGRFVRERNNNSLLPANETLELKEHAQVIFVKDDAGGRWVRGTTGQIAGLTNNNIRVRIFQNGIPELVTVEKVTWHNIRYESANENEAIKAVSMGSFTQFPLRLGWALSVRDSRGLQFEKVLIDMGEMPTRSGLVFQALCTAKSLKNLRLKTIISEEDLLVRDEVVRMVKMANNGELIQALVATGQAHSSIKNFVKQFDKGDFIEAIESFSKAITVKNNYRLPAFKRLMAFKFSRLRKGFQQSIPQQAQALPVLQPPVLVQQSLLENRLVQIEKIIEQIPLAEERFSQLEKAVQELTHKPPVKGDIEAKKADTDLKLILLSNELEAQQRDFNKSHEALNSVKEMLDKFELKNRGIVHANQILTENLGGLETNLSLLKKIGLIGGIILFVLAAAALLLAIL